MGHIDKDCGVFQTGVDLGLTKGCCLSRSALRVGR